MGITYTLCHNKTDSTFECNLSSKETKIKENRHSIEDGPIDKDKIAEYFLVNDDIVNYQGRETYSYYSLSKSKLYKNEASTSLSFPHCNQIHITHFDIFINNNYVITTDWEKTDISFLTKDKLSQSTQSSDIIFIGELLVSQEEPINLIANHRSLFCVLTKEKLVLYENKNAFNRRGKEDNDIRLEDIGRVIMFQYKPGENKNMFYCIGLVKVEDSQIEHHTTLTYYLYSEIKIMICYWMKLLSVLMKK